jgi:hypothetical protein
MINVQLAMYQMLTNVQSILPNNSSSRIRSIDEAVVTNRHHPSLKNHQKPLKRLIHKRQLSKKNITTSK